MKPAKGMKFNNHKIDGWKCSCGQAYYDPEQAQKILLMNKLEKEGIRAKLGQIRSNLIVRLPKDVERALGLKKGKDVVLKVEKDGLRIVV